ncbi:hypothetical protein D1007_55003 [Hordeum vulgare]|nr:hypothetical protein D1007_55003 [Hordeum vulgare]
MSSLSDVESSSDAPFGTGLSDIPLPPTRRLPDADLPLYNNWTPTIVVSLVEEIGYEFGGRIRAYWCVPGLTFYNNGLREIKLGENTMTENMKDCALNGNQFQQIYLGHDNSLRSYLSTIHVNSDDEDHPVVKFSCMRAKKEQVQEEQPHHQLEQQAHKQQEEQPNQVLVQQGDEDPSEEMHYLKVRKRRKMVTYQDHLNQEIMFIHFSSSIGAEKCARL